MIRLFNCATVEINYVCATFIGDSITKKNQIKDEGRSAHMNKYLNFGSLCSCCFIK